MTPNSFLVRSWGRVKRPVLSVYLVAFSRLLRAKSLQFVDETVDAGYATYHSLALVSCSRGVFFPVQIGRGPVPISSTPHFSFVKAHLGHEGAGWNKNDWKKYMTQESAPSVSAVAQRQGRFEKLIDQISDNPDDVHLLVALNPRLRGFEIVDGFHRAAILAVCRPGSTVSCSLVSHIVA